MWGAGSGCARWAYGAGVQAVWLLCALLHYRDLLLPTTTLRTHFDYIIGSGTAGSLIAHRIATETNYSYVVLEAGRRGNFLTDIPVLGPLLQGSEYDWGYQTVSQDYACQAMFDKKCKWPRGKIVGGSAILNNMIHLRGNLSHYVDWFDGKYDIDYFKYQFEYIENNILAVDTIQYQSELAKATLEAAYELGYNIGDLNENFNFGFMKSPVNQKSGGRWSTSHTLNRNKHNIYNNIVVDKILINENNIAYGVEYSKDGHKHKVFSKNGVIICAGAINTPKLLLLSGIGPKDHLNKIGIPVIKDLPVGDNLQDHVTTGLDLIIFNNSLKLSASDMLDPFHAFDYFYNGKGPFTSPGCEVVGILSTNNLIADLQFMVLPAGITSDKGAHLKSTIGIKDEVWSEYYTKLLAKQTASILPVLLHPKSKGLVRLSSKNSKDPPLIDPKYLSEEEDLDTLVKGLQIVQKFVNTKSMKNIGAHLNPYAFPNCEQHSLYSESYWRCYVRQLTLTSFHPVGTCKMGHPDSNKSVVDTSFKINGIVNLFVADGSVLPTLTSGNINAAVALMANVFFDIHFVDSKNIDGYQSCDKFDLVYNYYFRVCPVPRIFV